MVASQVFYNTTESWTFSRLSVTKYPTFDNVVAHLTDDQEARDKPGCSLAFFPLLMLFSLRVPFASNSVAKRILTECEDLMHPHCD